MDREELEKLLCDHYQFVINLTRILGIDPDDVEDVANEAMIDAFEALDSLREPELMKAWLRTIVNNEAKAYYSQQQRRRDIIAISRLEAGELDLADFAASEMAFQEMMQKAEAAEAAKEVMDYLDPVHRSIMYMRFWGRYKFREIGEILNIKDSTVRCMYSRCKARLCVRFAKVYGKEAGKREDKLARYRHLYDDYEDEE